MPSVYIKTYGCQMNERDSEQVARQLQQRGYSLAIREEDADVILLNTCSVRDQAEQKALGKMGYLQKLKKKNPRIVLGFMGCMAQSRGEELFDKLPDLDLVVGTQKYHHVADYVDRLALAHAEGEKLKITDVDEEAFSQNTIKEHILEDQQVSAFVSIMQGCNMRCTFCIVPQTRGKERSRPMAEILAEVRHLVSQGVREVTLLGQIVNLYGRNEFPTLGGKTPFVQLLYALQDVEGLDRIRFTSPHPIGLKEDLIQAFADLSKLCEHMHLPLQSGSDRLLKKMKRVYTNAQYREVVAQLRQAKPDIAITTDIIVGFPSETDEDYEQTRQLVQDIAFDNAFIFKYSPRRDTPAATMDEQLSQEVKEWRNLDLLEHVNRIAARKTAALVGQTVEILVEGVSKTNEQRLSGRTRGNKIVVFEGNDTHRARLVPIHIHECTNFTLYGTPAP